MQVEIRCHQSAFAGFQGAKGEECRFAAECFWTLCVFRERRIMKKKITSFFMALLLALTAAFSFGTTVFAADSSSASSTLSAAKEALEEAGEALAEAESLNNSYGFFLWLSENESLTSAQRSEAATAASVLAGTYSGSALYGYSSSISYSDLIDAVTIGAGTTTLENLLVAVEMVEYCNELRTTDDNFTNLSDYLISPILMAISELQTTYSSNYIGHTMVFYVGENLAWGYSSVSSAYYGWYTEEKEIYDAGGSGTTGHYTNIVSKQYSLTGAAYTNVKGSYSKTWGQVFNWSSSATGTTANAYTTEEFYALVVEYQEYMSSLIEELTQELEEAQELATATGLYYLDGTWYYLTDGEVNTDYTGLAQNSYGWWYVNEGVVDFTYTGLCKYNSSYWYVYNGNVKFVTGLYKINGTWYYIKSGAAALSYTGLASNSAGTWYVQNGIVTFSYTGLATVDGTTYYVSKSLVSTASGIYKISGTWYYFVNGAVASDYTGLASNSMGTWYVQNGVITLSYTGLATVDGTTYYVSKSLVSTASGIYKISGTWYYFVNGAVASDYTGLASNSAGTWYVQNGVITLKYTGTVTIDGVKYTVKNSLVTS